jgi:hypothetical protein
MIFRLPFCQSVQLFFFLSVFLSFFLFFLSSFLFRFLSFFLSLLLSSFLLVFNFRFSSFLIFFSSSHPPFVSSFFVCFSPSTFRLVFVQFLYLLILFFWPVCGFLTRTSHVCLLIRTLFTDAVAIIHDIYRKKWDEVVTEYSETGGFRKERVVSFRLPSFYSSISVFLLLIFIHF